MRLRLEWVALMWEPAGSPLGVPHVEGTVYDPTALMDGVGASHVLSSVPGGPTYAIARNQLNIGTAAAPEYSEFTGPWERYLG